MYRKLTCSLLICLLLLLGCSTEEQFNEETPPVTDPTDDPTAPTDDSDAPDDVPIDNEPVIPPTESELRVQAATYPAMPKDASGLIGLSGRVSSSLTFSSGLPFNDLEYTIFDTDYIDGETHGYDTFMPVDPAQEVPGADQIKIVTATGNVKLDTTYSGQGGDRIILGTAEIASPFFARGGDGLDNDYAVITSFDYNFGYIQLRGTSAEYGLVRCTLADGCATEGYYLFHIGSPEPDLVAFVFPCDDLPPLAGTGSEEVQVSTELCNDSKSLSLADSKQFRFALPVSTTVAVLGQSQLGTSGKEVVAGITTDSAGNKYVMGLTDGSFTDEAPVDNRVFVARVNADGSRGWVNELPLPDGSLLWDATTDNEHLYAVGRTLGALPGATNAGRWDGIILKIRLSDGELIASHQWGNTNLDGYGNVVLDDAGNLYVSGAGSPENVLDTDNQHLVAKHLASDLSNVWRQLVAPQATTGQVLVAEAWGGLSYIAGAAPGQGKLVAGGWFMNFTSGSGNAQGFLEVWSDLHLAAPQRVASAVVSSPGTQADWVMDNIVDKQGNIYAVGFTTGSLQGSSLGAGDAYIVKYDANLQNPVFRQIGTAQADAFRRMDIDDQGNVYAVGYTYGDYDGANADPSKGTGDVFVQKFDTSLNSVAALQFGTPQEDRGYLHLRSGTLYVGGMTEAALAGASQGSFDAYVVGIDAQTMEVNP
ncbi:MAG: SBBP repeat-containing protein [Trueperaceae bacterium]